MEERHELIYFKDNFPVKSFIHKLGDVPKHWHRSVELLWVMDGNVTIIVNDAVYNLSADDLIVINANEIHELHSDKCTMLAVQLRIINFGIDEDTSKGLYFTCNSSNATDKAPFTKLKCLIAELIKESQSDLSYAEYRGKAIAFSILATLLEKFKTERKVLGKSQKYLERLQEILSYINDNYKNNISIADVADHVHLSVPYFSGFFEKYMGMNFSEYYASYRLDQTVNEILSSDESIEAIALKHGFNEVHTFSRLFKKKYNMLPSEFRKQGVKQQVPQKGSVNYLEIQPEDSLSLLAKYSELPTQAAPEERIETVKTPTVNFNKTGTPIKQNFKKFLTVGRASEILQAHIQQMLKTAQREIGYEFIKFHGILSDDMLVCTRKNGKLNFSFTLIDKVIDFLRSINLKPLIQLSFMPSALAKNPHKTLFDSPFIISEPANDNEWIELVTSLLNHLIKRYGKAEAESWLYSFWNEPDTSELMFGLDDNKTFYELYCKTYRAVKSVDENLKFGSPSMLLSVAACMQWAEKFYAYVIKNGCAPDFLNIHYYTDEFGSGNQADANNMITASTRLSLDADNMAKFIDKVHDLRSMFFLDNIPIYLTEWNMTLSHRNLINDTCFLSCYLYKNLIDNIDRLDSFGYWSLSDYIEEHQMPESLYHGGLGMFTHNGIKKAAYNSFYLFNKLCGNLLLKGEGFAVAKCGDKIIIALYKYEHFNKAFSMGKYLNMTSESRYTPFTKQSKLRIEIPLEGVENGEYIIKEYAVNREYGSSFDAWVRAGALPLDERDMQYLEKSSIPNLTQYKEKISNNTLIYSSTLQPLEIKVVEIIR